MNAWVWALTALVAVLAALPIVVREVRLYRRGAARGGRLRFDTPEARAALRDPDDWFDE